jgi:hypothetical protein
MIVYCWSEELMFLFANLVTTSATVATIVSPITTITAKQWVGLDCGKNYSQHCKCGYILRNVGVKNFKAKGRN